MAEKSPTTPATRRRILVMEALVTQSGQYLTLDVTLPETAQRVTGLYAATLGVENQLYRREDAFVIFTKITDEEKGLTGNVYVEGSADSGDGVLLREVLRSGYKMARGYESFDPEVHLGFYQSLTDEVPLIRLKVPKDEYGQDLSVFYAHTVTMGRPKIVDGNGVPLALVTEPNFVRLQTFLSQYEKVPPSGPGLPPYDRVLPDSEAFLCRVEFPAANSDTFFQVGGYRDGILFPGDATRF